MSLADRTVAKEAFETASSQKGRLTVVVATSAFGMGMDYDRIPFVSHLHPRTSVQEFWQQAGRAGRGMTPPLEWAECLSLHGEGDRSYVRRFAKAPGFDGILNSFTIPAHGWIYVWRKGPDMCLETPKGRQSTFLKAVLEPLQEAGLASSRRERVGRNSFRFRLDLDELRTARGKRVIHNVDLRLSKNSHLRKVLRYLRIAWQSKAGRFVELDMNDYRHDKAGTVLQRLNRWVDLGLLHFDRNPARSGTIRLALAKERLLSRDIRAVRREASRWEAHKRRLLHEMFLVLASRSPIQRRKKVLAAFHRGGEKVTFTVPDGVPRWLRK